MIVPSFWAEATRKHRENRRQVTVRRFGWSDSSQEDAQRNADMRAEEALARILAGETQLLRHEPKIAYNGAKGVPIREEVLARHEDSVITRNSYGAHCLNTPNVLFADVDFNDTTAAGKHLGIYLLIAMIAGYNSYRYGSWSTFWVMFLVGSFLYAVFTGLRSKKVAAKAAATAEIIANERIAKFVAKHPDWSLRRYRTPNGYRILVQHRPFDPQEPAVRECFDELGVDKVYRAMCLNQNCFRARLTGKPWRMGIAAHMRPRPGTWPVSAAKLPLRQQWVAEYETRAAGFAACRYVDTLGPDVADSRVAWVTSLHDRESRALTELPLA